MKKTVLIVIAVILGVQTVFATDRFYADRDGQSPNGQYEAKATSPANRGGNWKTPFQKDFTITFRNTKTDKTLWKWEQGENDASPVELIPTDDGRLIMLDAWNDYHVFDTNGVKTQSLTPFNPFPKTRRRSSPIGPRQEYFGGNTRNRDS